jgi:hypothetical protein
MIKLLEAKDQDQFNRQKVSPFEGDLDNLTEEQVRSLIAWLEEKVLTAEAMEVLYDSERRQAVEVAEVTVPATSAPEAEKAELVSPIRFVSPFRGADGWPYKVERKKRK